MTNWTESLRAALDELKSERERVAEASIAATLEQIVASGSKRRGPGRPKALPAVLKVVTARFASSKGPKWSAAARAAARARMKAYWAARRAKTAAAKGPKKKTGATKTKPKWSPAARKAARDRAKAYWAARAASKTTAA